MPSTFYSRHQYPPSAIQHSVWLYFRFTLSYPDVEELLAQRGLNLSYETIRRWFLKFGPTLARRLRRQRPRPRPPSCRHLNEMTVLIEGNRLYLWRAVDDEGEILGVLAQRLRNAAAGRKLMRAHFGMQEFEPSVVVSDTLRSSAVAILNIGLSARLEQGLRRNNCAENCHLASRRRDRIVLRFILIASVQRFFSLYAALYKEFYLQRHLTSRAEFKTSRSAAMTEWRQLAACYDVPSYICALISIGLTTPAAERIAA